MLTSVILDPARNKKFIRFKIKVSFEMLFFPILFKGGFAIKRDNFEDLKICQRKICTAINRITF